jgi:sugar phosphate isomerase/epimerase
MRDRLAPGTTLSYCTNVHPGRTLREILVQLHTHSVAVKRIVSPDQPLALGLWIPHAPTGRHPASRAVAPLHTDLPRAEQRPLIALRACLEEHDLEAATFNAFPFHDFHEPVVKRRVYEPDWSTDERLLYTIEIAAKLRAMNPEGGSVSTVPIGWPSGMNAPRLAAAGERLRRLADLLSRPEFAPDRPITLDLEPEPGCILDTADDAIAFFDEHLPDEIHRRHIGVCHDICHAAVMFEDQRTVLRRYAVAGIRVNKVQISSALDVDVRTIGVDAAIEHLRPFAEPRYLHQTGVLHRADDPTSFELIEDLPDAIAMLERVRDSGDASRIPERLRVHFHVPVYLDSIGPLGTTNGQIAEAVAAAREYHETKHFEVETYAWGVLPEELKRPTLAEGIANELRWVLNTCGRSA